MLEIRLATLSEFPVYREHFLLHMLESAQPGDIIFSPYEEPLDWPEEAMRKEKESKWSMSPRSPGWERCWILMNGSKVVGDVKLVHQMGLKTSIHRATLMMGIQSSHRGQGWGTRLVDEALKWAKVQPTLEWIDLYVFSHNEPARKLYSKYGFKELAVVKDLFRIHGQKIDDIHMVLSLEDLRREDILKSLSSGI